MSQLLRMLQQGVDAEGKHVGHCLMTGDQQQEHHADDIVLVYSLDGRGLGDESVDERGRGTGRRVADQPTEIVVELGPGRAGRLVAVEAGHHGPDTAVEEVPVGGGHPEQLADDEGGYWHAEVGDQIRVRNGSQLSDDVPDDGRNPRA